MAKNSGEKRSLDEERNALAEERTVLAYIRTELAFFGVLILILRFYFNEFSLSTPLVIVLFIIGVIMVAREILHIKKLRKARARRFRGK